MIEKMITVLNNYYEKNKDRVGEYGIQLFDCPCKEPDPQECIFEDGDVRIMVFEGTGYMDILGLTDEEYKELYFQLRKSNSWGFYNVTWDDKYFK